MVKKKISKVHDMICCFNSLRYYLASLVHPSLPQETTVFQHLHQYAPPLMTANVFLEAKRSVLPLMNNNAQLHLKTNAKPTSPGAAPITPGAAPIAPAGPPTTPPTTPPPTACPTNAVWV